MYGSILRIVTLRPRLSSSAPIEAEARPLPSDDTTPPVTKMNLVRFAVVRHRHLLSRSRPPRMMAAAPAPGRAGVSTSIPTAAVSATLMRNPHSSARNCSSFSACSSGVGARRAKVSRKSRR